MKAERSARLYLIEKFLQSHAADHETRVKIIDAISIVADDVTLDEFSGWETYEDVCSGLLRLKLVTKRYDMRHFKIDLWFLTKQNFILPGLQRCSESDAPPEQTLLFQIILQALVDFQSGRPCDKGIWYGDMSSDYKKCSNVEHYCADNAKEYLDGLDHEEQMVGLPEGCIAEIVNNIMKERKGSPFGKAFL